MKEIIIGARGSKLAITQTELFARSIKEVYPRFNYRIKAIKTKGDKILDKSLREIGERDIFIREIEYALLSGEIDIAVHSLKDMPATLEDSFILACYPVREDPRDVLISRNGQGLNELPSGSVLGTGSFRRQVQVKRLNPDIGFVNIRGNVDTRIEKMHQQELAGLILAAAGLHRLELHHLITRYFEPEECLPPAGQGTLGIEIRKDRTDLLDLLRPLDNLETRLASTAERAFLATMEGNCHLAIGCYGRIEDSLFVLDGFLAGNEGEPYINGRQLARINLDECRKGSMENLEKEVIEMGEKLAEVILSNGGRRILAEMKE